MWACIQIQARIDAAERGQSSDPSINSAPTPQEEVKVLGVTWNPNSDSLIFDLSDLSIAVGNLQPTKRNLVSLIGWFYDPIGFLRGARNFQNFVRDFKIFQDFRPWIGCTRFHWVAGPLGSFVAIIDDCVVMNSILFSPFCFLDKIVSAESTQIVGVIVLDLRTLLTCLPEAWPHSNCPLAHFEDGDLSGYSLASNLLRQSLSQFGSYGVQHTQEAGRSDCEDTESCTTIQECEG